VAAPLRLLVIAHGRDEAARDVARRAAAGGLEVTLGATAAELRTGAPAADVLFYCSGGADVIRELWPELRALRWIHSRPAGVDRLLFPELVDSDVVVTNSRGVFSQALAEWVLAAVLFFAKDLRRLVRSQGEGRWDPFAPELVLGQTAGVLGLGDIGRACARMLRAAGLRTVGLRRRAGESDPDVDVLLGPDRLADLLGGSDYLVVALPLTAGTRRLIGAAELAAMRGHAVLLNVGRGAVVDEVALEQALRARAIRGAALDVFEQEPLPAGHAFYTLDNVLLSPHSADQVAGWREQAGAVFLDNLARYRAGQPLANAVDKRSGY
jgi:phosphoglycerate dehydrogenase-like enzyme